MIDNDLTYVGKDNIFLSMLTRAIKKKLFNTKWRTTCNFRSMILALNLFTKYILQLQIKYIRVFLLLDGVHHYLVSDVAKLPCLTTAVHSSARASKNTRSKARSARAN